MSLTKLKNPCEAKEYKELSRKIAYYYALKQYKHKVITRKVKVMLECREFELKELLKQREEMKA